MKHEYSKSEAASLELCSPIWHSGFGILSSFVFRHSDFTRRLLMNVERALAKTDQQDFFHRAGLFEKFFDLPDGDSRRPVHGKTVGAGADRGKGDRPNVSLFGQGECVSVTTGEQLVFAVTPIAPDRPHRVNHPFGRQPVALGNLRL